MFTKHILLHISRTETKIGTRLKMFIERKRDGERTIPVANGAMVVNKRSHVEPPETSKIALLHPCTRFLPAGM